MSSPSETCNLLLRLQALHWSKRRRSLSRRSVLRFPTFAQI